MYMLGAMPKVVINDPEHDGHLDLDDVFRNEVLRAEETRTFMVGEHKLTIRDALLRLSAEPNNAVHFCAHDRDVVEVRLSSRVAHADNPVKYDGVELRYVACVTGELLDGAVNAQRTGFDIESAPLHGSLFPSVGPTWAEVEEASILAAAEYLAPLLVEAKQRAVARLERVVEESEPRYRPLLAHRRSEVEQLSGNMSDDRLEQELHKIEVEWHRDSQARAKRSLEEIPSSIDEFNQFRVEAVRRIGEMTIVAQADLADYVLHRRIVLEFFAKLLGLMESGKFAREDVLHGLFFPTRTDSGQVDYETHNLWAIDERLAFHHYLASDLRFDAQHDAPIEVDSAKRPDLVIFNRRIALSESDGPNHPSIVLVEFKRPERDDDVPVRQVYGYIRNLREGKGKRPDGSSIDRVGVGVPFFCYVICTLTEKMRRDLEDLTYKLGPDGNSYFLFNDGLNAWVEVISYRKVLDDARKRNQAFFRRLDLPTRVT